MGGEAVGGGGGGRGGEIEITLLNPNGYVEAAARPLRPWLAALLAELLAAPTAAAAQPGGPAVAPAVAGETAGPVGGDGVSFGVRFAGDRAMRQANRQFRGKDRTTDVLSFPGGDGGAGPSAGAGTGPSAAGGAGPSAGGGHLGDVLISVPQARRQAAAAGRDPGREIRVLLLHGMLHCLGYDHEVDGGEMERVERRLRRRWIGPTGAPGARPARARRRPGRTRRAV
jgi:probable rRNA maturation factor